MIYRKLRLPLIVLEAKMKFLGNKKIWENLQTQDWYIYSRVSFCKLFNNKEHSYSQRYYFFVTANVTGSKL